MVVLNRIYTRTGDDGTTGLGNGERRAETRFARRLPIGTVDEANSAIGLCPPASCRLAGNRRHARRHPERHVRLGADLATPEAAQGAKSADRCASTLAGRPPRSADRQTQSALAPLRSFVLPGGSPLAAYMHLARTVTRRAERLVVELAGTRSRKHGAIRYLNRLSDFLFVTARIANDNGDGRCVMGARQEPRATVNTRLPRRVRPARCSSRCMTPTGCAISAVNT